MIIRKRSRRLGHELSYHSQKLNEILEQSIVRHALKNDMENKSVTPPVMITVRKFQKFQMVTLSFFALECDCHCEKS